MRNKQRRVPENGNAALVLCLFYKQLLQQVIIRKVVNTHGFADISQGGGSGLFGHGAAFLQDLHDLGQALLP